MDPYFKVEFTELTSVGVTIRDSTNWLVAS